ncbi:putative late blight resistance protein homolog R1B-8 [Coffea arabica]|uniref:Late blight resistance protein homolog R1B-8 n=1 Tax=Coffea arabica TaxID=13443 RepID=A0A6P6VGF6_COFAR|nr:disease resistance protein RGA2-like [Coffea arabica]
MPIDHEVMVGPDDENEKVIETLIKDFEDRLSVSSTIQSLPNSSHSLRAPEVSQTSSRMLSQGKMPIAREIMVGLDDEAAKVIERLVRGSKQVEIVPIVGMAGLALQKLKRKRYLVVFDDVWDIKVWNELRISFPDGKNQSRIIFTSRSSNVASQVQYGGEPHKIRRLTVEESFELLQKKVFGEEEECSQALHGWGMEIVKKCWGLPLALVVVAGVQATIEHDICVWEEFAESLTSTTVSDAEQCKRSMELSYEHLPYHLKACLLYFAAFREDEKIGAKKLMCLWIAEGFVEIIEGKRLEDIAEEYLMDLIGRNLVMVGTLLFFGATPGCEFDLLNISFLFCIYKHLNVLNLEGINLRLKELPTEVESLLGLRYVALTARHMKFIPPSVAKLSHLETFCLYSTSVVSLPDSIWNMKKLRHVCLRGGVVIEGENLLRRIPNVRRLKISDRQTGNGVLNMRQLECLESLTWRGNYSSDSREHVELSFPKNLKKLSLEALGLPCGKMSLIEQLPNLEVLKLRWLSTTTQP